MAPLPLGWRCRHRGLLDDPEFNNRHTEVGPSLRQAHRYADAPTCTTAAPDLQISAPRRGHGATREQTSHRRAISRARDPWLHRRGVESRSLECRPLRRGRRTESRSSRRRSPCPLPRGSKFVTTCSKSGAQRANENKARGTDSSARGPFPRARAASPGVAAPARSRRTASSRDPNGLSCGSDAATPLTRSEMAAAFQSPTCVSAFASATAWATAPARPSGCAWVVPAASSATAASKPMSSW